METALRGFSTGTAVTAQSLLPVIHFTFLIILYWAPPSFRYFYVLDLGKKILESLLLSALSSAPGAQALALLALSTCWATFILFKLPYASLGQNRCTIQSGYQKAFLFFVAWLPSTGVIPPSMAGILGILLTGIDILQSENPRSSLCLPTV